MSPVWLVAASLPILTVPSVVLAQEVSPAKSSEQRVAAGGLATLEQDLSKLDAEFAVVAAALESVIEQETKAGRLAKAEAAGLNFIARHANRPDTENFYVGSTIAATLKRTENPAVVTALQSLSKAGEDLQERQRAVMSTAIPEAIQLAREAVNTARRVEDVAPVFDKIAATRAMLKARPPIRGRGLSEWVSRLELTSQSLAQFQQLLAAEAADNPERMALAVDSLVPMMDRTRLPDSVPSDPGGEIHTPLGEVILERVKKELQPYFLAVDEAQSALDAALEARKPEAELLVLVDRLQKVVAKMPKIGRYTPPSQNYRAVVDSLSQTGDEFGSQRKASFENALNTVASLGSKKAPALRQAVLDRQAQLEAMVAKRKQEQDALWRARLISSKDATALTQLAADMREAVAVGPLRFEEGVERESRQAFLQRLDSLAGVWSTMNLALLASVSREPSSSPPLFAAEVETLRQQIERDLLARILDVPEISQPPLQEKETTAAIEALKSELSQRGEWRRLLNLVDGLRKLPVQRPGLQPASDLEPALKAMVAGENYEKAELWADAIASYKTVLSSTGPLAPVKAAATRIKDLQAAHPEVNKSAR